MRAYVAAGKQALRERGFAAWRRRQTPSISAGGRVRVLARSRKEESVLTPGGAAVVSGAGCEGADSDSGGGGGENGICWFVGPGC